jgi:hypothetical protein
VLFSIRMVRTAAKQIRKIWSRFFSADGEELRNEWG